jgi:hypothetical protein
VVRAVRTLLVFKLGAWVGFMTAAALARQALPSRGDEESDELALAAILNGIQLRSRAKAFRGGSLLAWFGGIELDLREAELAPDARLATHTLFGGIAITTPPEWRVESNAKALAGGVDARTPAADDPEAPVLTIDGMAVFGGIAVNAKPGGPRAAAAGP